MKKDVLQPLREGKPLSTGQQIGMLLRLSLPAMLSQISMIAKEYIDASMVGQMGAGASASIGLVSTSVWLFGGMCTAAATGFSVQVAQSVGAGHLKRARATMKVALVTVTVLGILLGALGAGLSFVLPTVLGGEEAIRGAATDYFFIFSLSLPFIMLHSAAGAMLQATGNMRLPSVLYVGMCLLDVVFNQLLIFPETDLGFMVIPGANMGVAGAALGTALSDFVIAIPMVLSLLFGSEVMHLRPGEKSFFRPEFLKNAFKIGAPVALERIVTNGAQIVVTGIAAPLGAVSLAANSLAVTAESLCYMPGYGVADAATAAIGQCVGAERRDILHKLGELCVWLGTGVQTFMAVLLYVGAGFMMGLLSVDGEVVALGTELLHMIAFIEPFFGAAIVTIGVCRGAGDTLLPSIVNFISMWAIRVPLAAILAPGYGIKGIWLAMSIELAVRGILFIIRLAGKGWMKKSVVQTQ